MKQQAIQQYVMISDVPAGVQIEGYVTGFGNPTWKATHPPATSTAPAVQVGHEDVLGWIAGIHCRDMHAPGSC